MKGAFVTSEFFWNSSGPQVRWRGLLLLPGTKCSSLGHLLKVKLPWSLPGLFLYLPPSTHRRVWTKHTWKTVLGIWHTGSQFASICHQDIGFEWKKPSLRTVVALCRGRVMRFFFFLVLQCFWELLLLFSLRKKVFKNILTLRVGWHFTNSFIEIKFTYHKVHHFIYFTAF